jgi:hypothetical protein
MAIGLITYQDTSRREDLLDVVTNISPKETPLLSGLPMGQKATQTLHEYTTDSFADYGDNAQVEAAGFSTVDLTQPTRSSNICQIFTDWVTVSETEIAVRGVTEPYNYQVQKNIVEHAKDQELAIMAGSRASGSSGVARRMAGIINALTTNATTRASGSSLGETDFNDIMNLIWNSTSDLASEVYVGATLKRDISGFTAGNTKFISAEDKRLVRPVDVYESDFGISKIFLHRNVPNGANAKTVVAINPKYHLKSYLRATNTSPLERDGDRRRAMIVTEMTLEHRGEKSGAVVGGYTS